jgi:hypothetical protein
MSTKNEFLASAGFLAALSTLVAVVIVLASGSAAVSQQPPEAPSLAGGFKIDFGNQDEAAAGKSDPQRRDYRSAQEVVRDLMEAEAGRGEGQKNDLSVGNLRQSVDTGAESATKTPAEPPAQSPEAATATPPAAPPQTSVAGLPQAALPMAFPAAAPQFGSSKGPATLINAGDMIGFSRELGDGVQAITIINASRRWMAVYHIDTSGQIRLTSSRPLDADFTIQFNATAPLPEDIRRLQGK